MTIALILSGFLLLLIGGEAVLRGAIGLSRWLGLPKALVGVLIVGVGTSLPETMIAIDSVLAGVSQIAVGNVIGANIANTLLVLAAAAFVHPIVQPSTHLRTEGGILIGASTLVLLIGLQGRIHAWQGALMIGLLAMLMTFYFIRGALKSRQASRLQPRLPLEKEIPTRPLVAVLLLSAGVGSLLLGADLLVKNAVIIARQIGVSEGLIGLTVISIGSTLPELVSAVVASYRKQAELAYGNLLGSFLFNILGILGLASLIGTVTFPAIMVRIDGIVMIAAVLMVFYFLKSKGELNRREGAMMIIFYVLYVAARYTYSLIYGSLTEAALSAPKLPALLVP